MTRVFVAAGSNIEPEKNLAHACREIARAWPGAEFSRAFANRAVGFDGPDFVNMVVGFATTESIGEVLARLREIETLCGRPRHAPKWASRAMDLDILLFGALIEKTADYTVPRPDLLKRPYMLGPLAELAPGVLHPIAGQTIGALWAGFDRAAHAMTPVALALPSPARNAD
jgi:2-amino-4-hydroxy-6-hydroxymethyldihydropteridine diphosphokinase